MRINWERDPLTATIQTGFDKISCKLEVLADGLAGHPCECATSKRSVSSMPKSKISKLSSSTSKHSTRPPRGSRVSRKRGKKADSEFSILKFPFAIPSSLRVLLRLAACLALFAQICAEASPRSLWKEDHSRSNDSMLVEGKRETLVSRKNQEAVLHGIVRSEAGRKD
jgi:hypothetical protein